MDLRAHFTPKRKAERKRYEALRQLNMPPTDAIELSTKTFAELRQMGYNFRNPQPKPGEKQVKQTSKTTKCSKRSRYDALKRIGVSFNLDELSKKSFAELKQMGFKFTQKPSEKPLNQSFKAVPKETLEETEIPQPPQKQAHFVQGIRVRIKDAIPMTDSQLEKLSHTILEKIAGMPQGEGPRFNGYSRKPGWLHITCADQRSKDWLEELIPSLKPWPEAILEILSESERPKPDIAVVFIPNTDTTMIKRSLSLIRAQNALQTELWKVLHSKAQHGGVILTLSLDSLSVENLQKKGLKANLGFHKVQFRLKGQKAHQSGTDSFSTSLPMDQGLPGTYSSDPKLAPAPKAFAPARFHPATDSPDTRKVFPVPPKEDYRDIESSSMGDKDTEYRAVTQLHQRYPSTDSYRSREDIRRDNDRGTSYSGRDHFKEGASYSSREGIPRGTAVTSYNDRHGFKGVDSYCSDEDIRKDFAGGSSYTGRCASYSRREDMIRDASYSGIEDVRDRDDRGDIRGDFSSSYKNRDREDIRGDMNRSYIGREVIAKDADGGTSYIGREDIRGDISGGIDQFRQQYPKRDIHDDISEFREKRYLREERSRSPSSSDIFRGRDNFAGTRDGQIHQHVPRSTDSYKDWDIVEDIRGINRDINEFRGRSDSQIHRHFPPSTVSYGDKDIGEDIRRFNEGTSSFKGRKGSQIHQQFPPSTESYRDRNFGEDRGVNGGISFGGRRDSQIHRHFPPSTVSYRDRDIGEDIRFNEGTSSFEGRKDSQVHQQFPPSTESYRDRNFREDREVNGGTSFGGRGDSQIHRHFPPSTLRDRDIGEDTRRINEGTISFESRKDSQIHQQFPPSTERDRNFGEDRGVNGGTSFGSRGDSPSHQSPSNWGNSSINSMGREYTRESHGVMLRHTRRDTQRYTKGDNRDFSTGNSQRYTRGDDKQCYKRKR